MRVIRSSDGIITQIVGHLTVDDAGCLHHVTLMKLIMQVL